MKGLSLGSIVLFFLFFVSCSEKNQFTIEGTVDAGSGKTLYLENVGTNSVYLIDSVKISDSGAFKFQRENTSLAPDFYRLRLNNQFINLVVDSTETLFIAADTLHFAKEYTINGSEENKNIKELTLLQARIYSRYHGLAKQFENKQLSTDQYLEAVSKLTAEYKEKASPYIYENPGSSSAYFALFQQVDNMLIFDPYDSADLRLFGAVANVWNSNYPDAPRTKHLVDMYTRFMAISRGQNQEPINWEAYEKASLEIFDFALNDYNGKEIKLSDVSLGKTLLLDFTAYQMPESPAHNILLAEIYEKYKNQGFEIMQVSLDSDEHFWKNAAYNLPWICVRDPRSVYSEVALKYNVREIPCSFILTKEGEIAKRIEDYTKLEKDVAAFLK